MKDFFNSYLNVYMGLKKEKMYKKRIYTWFAVVTFIGIVVNCFNWSLETFKFDKESST